jgi:AcrR family transcriptional regulator
MATTLYQKTEPELTSIDKILEASTRVVAAHGDDGTTFKKVGDAAGVSTGLVQHYFKTKKDLLDATGQHVLKQVSAMLEATPLPERDPLTEAGRRFVSMVTSAPHLMKYISRSLADGGEVGHVMFRWLYELSCTQGDTFAAEGMLAPDLDQVWGALNPVILRVGTFILAEHIGQFLPEPFTTPTQIHRWEKAFADLIRHGQLNEKATPEAL